MGRRPSILIRTNSCAVLVAATVCLGVCCTGSDLSPAPPPSRSEGGLFFSNGALAGIKPDCDARRPGEFTADASSRAADGALCTASREVSFVRDVKPIFDHCSGETCHNGTWGSGDPLPYLVGVAATECCDGRRRIAPGNPAASYVIQKLTGQHLCMGRQMPPGSPLSDTDIKTLSDWICLGAVDDGDRG